MGRAATTSGGTGTARRSTRPTRRPAARRSTRARPTWSAPSATRSTLLTGRRPEPGIEYPHLGAVCAKLLGSESQSLPGNIQILPRGDGGFGKQDAAFLGPKYGSVTLGDGKPPADLLRPAGLSDDADKAREEFRRKLNDRDAQLIQTARGFGYTLRTPKSAPGAQRSAGIRSPMRARMRS